MSLAGRVAFDTANAESIASSVEPVILVRSDIDTADVAGFATASGALTAKGGRTAHASLIAAVGEILRRELCRIGGGRRRTAG